MGDEKHPDDLHGPDELAGETPAGEAPPAGSVTRSVTVDAPVTRVWDAVSDPERRAGWLDDDEARRRVTRLDRVEPGHRLSWTWWDPGSAGSATEVEVALHELPADRTQVVVTERPAVSGGVVEARASATAGGGGTVSAQVPAPAAAAPARRWERRLLGLELLLVATAAVMA